VILTLELDKSGECLDVFFDEEGRDYLVDILSGLREPGDHYHLIPEAEDVAEMTHRFTQDGKIIGVVTLGLPSAGMKPIKEHEG